MWVMLGMQNTSFSLENSDTAVVIEKQETLQREETKTYAPSRIMDIIEE